MAEWRFYYANCAHLLVCIRRKCEAEVLEMLANGMSAGEIQEDFPVITSAHVRACLLYAAYKERIVLLAAA